MKLHHPPSMNTMQTLHPKSNLKIPNKWQQTGKKKFVFFIQPSKNLLNFKHIYFENIHFFLHKTYTVAISALPFRQNGR